MDKGNKKGSLINKTWERCKSFGRGLKSNKKSPALGKKSKSWPRMGVAEHGRRVAPEGCFTVYVGPEKQRFVVKTEYANHPLFRLLLEEAESEFGYDLQGPLTLPCHVSVFYRVLSQMAPPPSDELRSGKIIPANRLSSYHLLTPPRMIAINQF